MQIYFYIFFLEEGCPTYFSSDFTICSDEKRSGGIGSSRRVLFNDVGTSPPGFNGHILNPAIN